MGFKQQKLKRNGVAPTTVKVPADLVAGIEAFRQEQRITPSLSAALRYLVERGLDAIKDPCPNCGGGDPIYHQHRQTDVCDKDALRAYRHMARDALDQHPAVDEASRGSLEERATAALELTAAHVREHGPTDGRFSRDEDPDNPQGKE